jgi:hypothetical protein
VSEVHGAGLSQLHGVLGLTTKRARNDERCSRRGLVRGGATSGRGARRERALRHAGCDRWHPQFVATRPRRVDRRHGCPSAESFLSSAPLITPGVGVVAPSCAACNCGHNLPGMWRATRHSLPAERSAWLITPAAKEFRSRPVNTPPPPATEQPSLKACQSSSSKACFVHRVCTLQLLRLHDGTASRRSPSAAGDSLTARPATRKAVSVLGVPRFLRWTARLRLTLRRERLCGRLVSIVGPRRRARPLATLSRWRASLAA